MSTHGGKRPNSGGKRPGAGRPKGPPTAPLHLRVPEALLGAFRAVYGDGTQRRVVELMEAEVRRLERRQLPARAGEEQ